MTPLLRQAAELLADAFLRLARPKPRDVWQFTRGEDLVIVSVEVVSKKTMEAYNEAMTVTGWVEVEDAITVA